MNSEGVTTTTKLSRYPLPDIARGKSESLPSVIVRLPDGLIYKHVEIKGPDHATKRAPVRMGTLTDSRWYMSGGSGSHQARLQ